MGPLLSRYYPLLIAVAVLAAVTAVAVSGWRSAPDVEMAPSGYIALVVGCVVTLAIGIGLMTLVFYSNRHGYDDRAAEAEILPEEPAEDRRRKLG